MAEDDDGAATFERGHDRRESIGFDPFAQKAAAAAAAAAAASASGAEDDGANPFERIDEDEKEAPSLAKRMRGASVKKPQRAGTVTEKPAPTRSAKLTARPGTVKKPAPPVPIT